MNSTSHASDSSLDSKPLGSLGYTLGLCLGILVIFFVVTYISYTCKRARNETTIHNHHSLIMTTIITIQDKGLDESTISSYPQITYSDAMADAAACTICLADYANGDLLRLLPDCGHLFHLMCIDPWLLLHSSCPVCRQSPSPAPLAPAGSSPT